MALLYGKPTEYAIRALTYLAARPEQEIVSVQEIAQVEDISSHHLSKVMNQLARGKMVQPLRGPGGGYKLIRHPDQITLWEVMGCLGARDDDKLKQPLKANAHHPANSQKGNPF